MELVFSKQDLINQIVSKSSSMYLPDSEVAQKVKQTLEKLSKKEVDALYTFFVLGQK